MISPQLLVMTTTLNPRSALESAFFFLNLTFTIINFIIVEDIDSGVYVLIKTILYNI
jgi:hypothetical protein